MTILRHTRPPFSQTQIKVLLQHLTCDLQLRALNISKNTKHVKVIVVSRAVILSSII